MEGSAKKVNPSDHLANERTLLAWVRTGIGIMGFGFVVVKFSLFVRQISIALGNKANVQEHGYSGPIGVVLVAVGALSLLLAVVRYHQTAKQLERGEFKYSPKLLYGLVAFIFISGLLLLAYLVKTA